MTTRHGELRDYIGKENKPESEKTLIKTNTVMKNKIIEEKLFELLDKYYSDVDMSYDVVANEFPYFKTLGYTEWTGSVIIYPLNMELKNLQILEAYYDNAKSEFNYVKYLKDRIKQDPNKYKDRNKPQHKSKEVLVVLPGSNKLKTHTCLNKLKTIVKKHGCNNVWFKPHPLTFYKDSGELMDLFGKNCVLDRDEDLYYYLQKSKIIYTSHHSESTAYAFALKKEIEPIDVFNRKSTGAFSHINNLLFINYNNEGPKLLNKIYASPKSGIINLNDPKWEERLKQYLDYIYQKRELYKGHYIKAVKQKKK